MNRKLKDEDMDILFRGILKLQTVEDCYDFFEDLCTIAELRAMVQRFQVARMLDEGRIYSDIVQETGASTATPRISAMASNILALGMGFVRRTLASGSSPPFTSTDVAILRRGSVSSWLT